MLRSGLLLAVALLWPASSVLAQTADTIGATLTSKTFAFDDQFQFIDYSTAITGELVTGGITTTATVTKYVPETQTQTVTRYKVQFTNGRISIVPTQVEKQVTVYKPVSETQEITLPEVTGAWYSWGGVKSLWLINSRGTSDLVWGYGLRNGTSINGFVIYISGTSPVATGIYQVTATPATL